jgi:hypothetical protein
LNPIPTSVGIPCVTPESIRHTKPVCLQTLKKCSYLQPVRSFTRSMTKRRQKFHGTKLAQSDTIRRWSQCSFVRVN